SGRRASCGEPPRGWFGFGRQSPLREQPWAGNPIFTQVERRDRVNDDSSVHASFVKGRPSPRTIALTWGGGTFTIRPPGEKVPPTGAVQRELETFSPDRSAGGDRCA